MTTAQKSGKSDRFGYLEGQMLIAMPSMGDPRFSRSVVFLCAHSKDGAMGIVINKLATGITFPDLLEQLGIEPAPAPRHRIDDFKVHFGGPVETARGFVLHSSDYQQESSSIAIADQVSLTATVDILKAIATGNGPSRTLLALGYAGWSAGQLENEIRSNGWLHCDADDDLLFNTSVEQIYDQALAKIGVDPSFLSGVAGNA